MSAFSAARHGHPVYQERTTAFGTAHDYIAAHPADAKEHILQIACDGDLLDWISDLAPLYPIACGASRVVASDTVYAMAEQFRYQYAFTHFCQ